jgi:NADPH2:quinone reductase
MKAVRVHETGAAEVLRYEDVDDPRPAAGEALVKIAAAGVNYLDVYYRSGFHWGGHHKRSLPYIPGAEAAGTVVAVGSHATDVKVGDRVAWNFQRLRFLCRVVRSPKLASIQTPSSITFETAAATMLQGMTAHYLTYSTVAVKPADRVLVHAAAGGTGLLLFKSPSCAALVYLALFQPPPKRASCYRRELTQRSTTSSKTLPWRSDD